MPPVLQGSWTDALSDNKDKFSGSDHGYKYPYGKDLRPGSEIHDKLVTRVMQLARDSYTTISKKHETWREIDKTLTAYIPLSEYEKSLKKKDSTRPVSIVIPHSYAVLESALAYNTKAFLSDEVIFMYEGDGPEDTLAATLLQLVVNQQARRFKSALDIHTGFRDGYAYGFHASSVVWSKRYGKRPVSSAYPVYSNAGTPLGIKRSKENQYGLLFEGNEITPLDPYRCLPDPNVGIHRAQKGEFFGWYEFTNIQNLSSLEQPADSNIFNVKYLKDTATGQGFKYVSQFTTDASARSKEGIGTGSTLLTQEVPVVNMYAKIVPKEWGLPGDEQANPDGEYPEIWAFLVANDTILLSCGALGLNHDMFPVAFNSPDYDGYSIAPISRMELDAGLQTALNFLFNSHITNVRKAINDMLIVDPSLISMKDLQNPEPGKLIRLRRSAWGRGTKDAVSQLQITDITRANIGDASFVMDLMQKIGASSDAVMGVQRNGGPDRVTAAEFSGTFGSAISRLERLATITSLMYMQDLGFLHASHTQQLMSEDTFVKAVGDWPKILMEEYGGQDQMPSSLPVSPFDVLTDTDIICKDASRNNANNKNLAFWQQMFPAIIQQPLLYGVLEIPQIFRHIARLAGEKNVSDFISKGGSMQAQMIGDAVLGQQVSAGNLVPVDQAGTGGGPA